MTAIAMWRAPEPGPSLGQRILATLGFDSWAVSPVLVTRSALPTTRQLLFSAEERDVDLRISWPRTAGEPVGLTLAGQVLGPDDAGEVSLVRDGSPVGTVPLDEFGEFRFVGLEAGSYALTLRFGEVEIVLPPIDIGHAAPP